MKLKIIATLFFATVATVACDVSKKDEKATETKNQVIETIMNRRTIRAYKPEQIKDEELNKILESAIYAPSAMNRQSWEIRVIQDRKILDKMPDSFHKAPALIVIASETDNFYSPVDCGLLGQNILLAAESLGIGTGIVGSLNRFLEAPEGAEVLQSLQLSAGFKPLFCIAIGYKNEKPVAKPRDKSKIKIFK